MENLEKYIKENLKLESSFELPQGHKDRFMAKLEEANNANAPKARKVTIWNRRYLFGTASAAAAIIIALFITLGHTSEEDRYKIEIQELAHEMYLEEALLLQLFTDDQQHMINSIKTITEEAVPLSEQLPAELPAKKRAEILREYYKAKTASLKQIKTLYAVADKPIE